MATDNARQLGIVGQELVLDVERQRERDGALAIVYKPNGGKNQVRGCVFRRAAM